MGVGLKASGAGRGGGRSAPGPCWHKCWAERGLAAHPGHSTCSRPPPLTTHLPGPPGAVKGAGRHFPAHPPPLAHSTP